MSVEIINGRPLVSSDVTQETKPLDIYIDQHQSIVVFNVIKSPLNPIILGLSGLDRYNLDINWSKQKLEFQSNEVKKIDSLNIGGSEFISPKKPAKYQLVVS